MFAPYYTPKSMYPRSALLPAFSLDLDKGGASHFWPTRLYARYIA